MYDIKPVKVNINRWKFDEWKEGKLDKSELEGNKVILHKIRAECKNNTSEKKPTLTISKKEKEIMDIVYKIISNNTYAIENDLCNNIEGYSKALVQRTVRNKDILDLYGLERVRATKKIKQKLGITDKGYPILIVKNRGECYE